MIISSAESFSVTTGTRETRMRRENRPRVSGRVRRENRPRVSKNIFRFKKEFVALCRNYISLREQLFRIEKHS
ncbi:hypothetical protein SSCH_710036 [Syntrophaceticus schinkii]|uniref:Uncharacterized protein n=1 Tax=Syntrophaceticus schinkii TaxID=499207 RepID=A0A0B7MPD2_9FIRM|nr:hypothetical protein SSCH_710036 [Syntrophaceticus schinkii]